VEHLLEETLAKKVLYLPKTNCSGMEFPNVGGLALKVDEKKTPLLQVRYLQDEHFYISYC
jgi:hypothetical protein